jgi:hypothetical protein
VRTDPAADMPVGGTRRTDRAAELVRRHVARYPGARPQDVYKLLYQACMGPEHAMADAGTMMERLAAEWRSLDANPGEELHDDLGVHFPVYRINLRAAKARKVGPEEIVDSFVELGRMFPKDPELLVAAWAGASSAIRGGGLRVPGASEVDDVDGLVKANGYPAVHHSQTYRERYRPAYRLVHRRFD